MIAVGIDTHGDFHVACIVDELGQVLGQRRFQATLEGARNLEGFVDEIADGRPVRFAMEGTGSYGALWTEYLTGRGREVYEVERPRRRERRKGKSDSIDAAIAARKALTGEGLSKPRSVGKRQALRALLVGYTTARDERVRLKAQLEALVLTAPMALRERLDRMPGKSEDRFSRLRLAAQDDVEITETVWVMRDLAKRIRDLRSRERTFHAKLETLVEDIGPGLLDEHGVGTVCAAEILVCDPDRYRNQAAFAMASGVCPLEASSGHVVRHRLNRGGDRRVNSALHMVALTRARSHPESQVFLAKKRAEGKTAREAMRSLKRHLARRLFRVACNDLRTTREPDDVKAGQDRT